MNRRLLTLICSAAALGSCAPGVTVPRPNAEPSRPVPPVEMSTIRIPVTIDLASTIAQAETSVPKEFAASDDWTVVDRNAVGDVGLRFGATRDPLGIAVNGRRVTATSRVRYWIEIAQRVTKPIVGGSFWQKLGSCGRGEALREVEVGLESQITANANWELQSKTTLRTPTFTNQCRMTFLKVNVTDRVAGAFSQALTRAAATVDQTIAQRGNFRPMAEKLWKQLQEPIMLDSGFALRMNPTGAGLLDIAGNGRTVVATLGVTAYPAVTYGAAQGTRSGLASLATDRLPDGFHVSVDGELSFAEINRQLSRRLTGTTQKVQGRSIRVDHAEAYGSGDRIVLQLVLSGDMKGTIYLVGRPTYDPKTALLSLDDLDYSLETREALLSVADWLYHEGFRRSIAEQARWGLDRGIEQVKARVQGALNRELAPGIRSIGSVNSVRPVGVYVTAESLRARVVVDGTLRIEVR